MYLAETTGARKNLIVSGICFTQSMVDIICLLNLADLFSKLYLTVQKAGSEKRKGGTTRER